MNEFEPQARICWSAGVIALFSNPEISWRKKVIGLRQCLIIELNLRIVLQFFEPLAVFNSSAHVYLKPDLVSMYFSKTFQRFK